MDKLERFFEDVHAIREMLEEYGFAEARMQKIEAETLEANAQNQIKGTNHCEGQKPMMPVQPTSQAPMPTAPVAPTTVVPTAPQAESFTFEQIAQAMANAQAVGKMELVQTIFRTFNAQTLMQINPANYNQIAVMLRNEGIQL